MRPDIEQLRDRRDDIIDMIGEERDKDNPDQTRIDDLVAERDELNDRIEEIEYRQREEEERRRRL
jgi:seryl-tRNA synthetase